MTDARPIEPALRGFATTFHEMFSTSRAGAPAVGRIEIPLIQRDYAQGRRGPRTDAIRATFLDALHRALTQGKSVGLDFIYGEVREADGGTGESAFEPLDGQQRLTTLFLLHWYLAVRRGDLGGQAWTRFTYATRPSARLFCERIVANPPPSDFGANPPSAWIKDQSWYLHLWRFDPTISSMLVTLDAIADRFVDVDPDDAWSRLTDPGRPAIWFQLLPIADMAQEDLYIKMNSRGKPLTDFEAFKAFLGQQVADVATSGESIGGIEEFGHRIDGAWTDVLWPYRGGDGIVDDEFMRYFAFLIEVCEWREGRVSDGHASTPERRVEDLLRATNPRRGEHLTFIMGAFETWTRERPADYFDRLFTLSPHAEKIRLFGNHASADLFHGCCRRYGDVRGTTRLFSLTDTLLLVAVLVHRQHDPSADATALLRTLRNVNEASQFEMRVANMPKFVDEVFRFMLTGDLAELRTFNSNQVDEEHAKRELLESDPDLAPSLVVLENHALLRGTLVSFDLDAAIAPRAAAFESAFDPAMWPLVTGSLLACGDYQRADPSSDRHRFGSPTTDSVWRSALVDRGDRAAFAPVRRALGVLLDRLTDSPDNVAAVLTRISEDFFTERAARQHYDWRYHLVRYPEMREGNTGIYYGADGGIGYELTMLRRKVQRSWYRDAYLYAIWSQAGRPDEVDDPWFYGYSTEPRWMVLNRSSTEVRSAASGLLVRAAGGADDHRDSLNAICEAHGGVLADDGTWVIALQQRDHDGALVDAVDRVQVGADLVRAMVGAGL